MLPAAARMRRSDEFAAVLRRGRRAGRGPLVVHLLLPTEPAAAPARAGFVVGRGVGSAVARNLVRRRLRHVVRDRLPGLPPGSALVIRALPESADLSFHELSANVDGALLRLTPARDELVR